LYVVGALLLGNLTFAVFVILGVAALGGGTAEDLVGTPPTLLVVGALVPLVAAIASVWFAGRFFDHRPFSDFGLQPMDRHWWLDFGFGLFLGALLMTGIFLVELAASWVTITGTFEVVGDFKAPFFLVILVPVVFFLCVGVYEELLSRGYQLRNMAEGLNYPNLGPKGAVVLAWILSSLLFGLFHSANPGASTAIVAVVVNITFAGLLLGLGYILTGRLAIPIGLHIAWNFFQGNVFGFRVSGLKPVGATFISIEQGGPPLWTGGAFGPEAGLIEVFAIIVGSLLIWLWVRVRSGKADLQTSIANPPPHRTEHTPGEAS
jgi:membrane protease YdiL (CAAX protease family)